ncbi:hypothetical protein FN846DRAFT_913652 [Sphaerosporella brunnea]|uniref:SH3 domain-containing protein n=1 Tax=Sphaerosporella brunnea TaxID=1250544 RepID=A0A5J5EFS9_9PEZI|nr:hypothetical protein FN846DRAFT_913652 [Sphaerosporella brunnea]
MSPFIGSPASTPRLESAQSYSKKSPRAEGSYESCNFSLSLKLGRSILTRSREAEYIAWSLPTPPTARSPSPTRNPRLPRGKAKGVRLSLIALCSPGAAIFAGKKLEQFTATAETRCVRDIKRSCSWKIYGVAFNALGEKAHYVRVQLGEKQDAQFQPLATLLDSIAAKRHVALPHVRPFGLGFDYSVPAPHSDTHIYAITHCAKATPYLRKINVDFELHLGSEWKRLDLRVDRVGFAVYKSAGKEDIRLSAGPEEIKFQHDPYLRFARMTLRFGERPERTYIDIEDDGRGKDKVCTTTRTKKGSVVFLPRARVRTCDADGVTREPISTMIRLIFREKESGGLWGRGNGGVAAAAEAEKMASLIRKTTRLAAANPLGIKSAVGDLDIYTMNIKGVVAAKGYAVTNVDDGHSYSVDLRDAFRDCKLYAVPSLRGGTNGIVLISHSRDGEAVLRQHIDNPAVLISSITDSGFTVPVHSTLVRTKDGNRSIGKGNIRYSFNHGEADAGMLVEILVKLMAIIDATRLPELTHSAQLMKKSLKRERSDSSAALDPGREAPGRTPVPSSPASSSHTRNFSNVSNVSGYSTLSNTSTASEVSSSREPSDWDIYESPCEIAVMFDDSEPVEQHDAAAADTPTEKLARAKQSFTADLSREVGMDAGEMVVVRFRNNHWCFVKRRRDGEEGWVPTGYLDILN